LSASARVGNPFLEDWRRLAALKTEGAFGDAVDGGESARLILGELAQQRTEAVVEQREICGEFMPGGHDLEGAFTPLFRSVTSPGTAVAFDPQGVDAGGREGRRHRFGVCRRPLASGSVAV
jgi:hypothetical protein